MKKVLKFFGLFLLFVVLLVVGFASFVQLRGIPTYQTKPVAIKVQSTPEKVARGEKIAAMLCASCHKSADGTALSGRLMLDAPKEFGELHAANITQDRQYGIGTYTDGELAFMLRTGVKRNGKLAPIMPKFTYLSDNDLESIICYLRSDRPLVQAKAIPSVACDYSFLSKFLCLVAFKASELPASPIPEPDTTNMVQYGRYLAVNLYSCYACHSADFKTLNEQTPEQSQGFFGGGNTLLTMEGKPIKSSNITFHETGIGKWDLPTFSNALRNGIVPGKPALRYPMEPYARLTDKEVEAIYTYLKSIPKLDNTVPRS